jgi:hypothetical protein
MMQRFFRTENHELYESVRLGLDAAWGHEPPTTCFEPAATAPKDGQGRIVLAVKPEFADMEAVQATLPGLLAGGFVVEITEADYMTALPQP